VIKPNLPLRSAPQLTDFPTFLAYVRSPKARDGSETVMPPFPADRLTEEQGKEIYDYVVTAFRGQ
jgi:mono/diheme cytochrome c family protein